MLRRLLAVLGLAGGLASAAVLVPASGHAQQGRVSVDVELVLAADGSGSIDDDELLLQRHGYAAAIESPEVLSAVASGLNGRIAILYLEWGAPESQHVIVDWTVIEGPASAAAFAAALRRAPRAAFGYNSISAAVDRSVALIEGNPYSGLKRVIDVSGDGPNIGGRPVDDARDDAVDRGMTINALAISRTESGTARMSGAELMQHYREQVIGGPESFVMGVDATQPFAVAVRRKLVQEIASLRFLQDQERRAIARSQAVLNGPKP